MAISTMDFIINESHLSLKSMAITYYYLSLICYNKSNESKSKLMMTWPPTSINFLFSYYYACGSIIKL